MSDFSLLLSQPRKSESAKKLHYFSTDPNFNPSSIRSATFRRRNRRQFLIFSHFSSLLNRSCERSLEKVKAPKKLHYSIDPYLRPTSVRSTTRSRRNQRQLFIFDNFSSPSLVCSFKKVKAIQKSPQFLNRSRFKTELVPYSKISAEGNGRVQLGTRSNLVVGHELERRRLLSTIFSFHCAAIITCDGYPFSRC